jgi:predicted amidohydrolase YtcJ
MALRGANIEVIDLGNRTVIPGLNDSQMHPIRGGLNYNMELRWDGVPSLADALRMLKEQAQRIPPEWVPVVGGSTEFQFAERHMPTLEVFQNGVRSASAPTSYALHVRQRARLESSG